MGVAKGRSPGCFAVGNGTRELMATGVPKGRNPGCFAGGNGTRELMATGVPKGRHRIAQGGRARAAGSGTLGLDGANRESSEGAAQRACAAHAGLTSCAAITQGSGRFASSTLGYIASRFQRFVGQIWSPGFVIVRLSALYQANVRARFFYCRAFSALSGKC